MRGMVAGLRYAAAVFTLGFALGALRTLVLTPQLGELAATALELPVILAAAWLVCGAEVRRAGIGASWPARAVMGGVAMAALLVAEVVLALTAMDRTPGQIIAGYGQPAQALGLAGQVAFALLPLLQRGARAKR